MLGIRFTRWLASAGLPLTAAACFVVADTPPPTKRVVEMPVKQAVANTAPATTEPMTKREVEAPVKGVVANATPAKADDNPTVEAGLVKWHQTLDDAQTAAKKSGKPVLLFQMMGRLDKQFC